MQAKILYDKLYADFITNSITDLNWAARMPLLSEFLQDSFIRTGMGLMCDFTNQINAVYTTVFLSDNVLKTVLQKESKALLFSHHPTRWSIHEKGGNYAPDSELLALCKKKNISIFILHHPLDNYGIYSTCKTLAEALSLTILKPAFLYYGALCGVICTTELQTVTQLKQWFSIKLKNETSLYKYGEEGIQGKKIAVCPGGGNDRFVLNEMQQEGIYTLITGVTLINDYSRAVHDWEQMNKINVLGGTHYATEKFAPMKMCSYFNDLGLKSEFIPDEPDLFDL